MSIKGKGPIFDPGLCRCCGALKKCRLLNVEYQSCGQKEVYSDMLMDCFGLLLSHLESRPTDRLVCATCVTRLREACSFKKQVLQCEEAFMQVKMCTDGNEFSMVQELPSMEQALVEGGPKLELEALKAEPYDRSAQPSPAPSLGDALAGTPLPDDDDDEKPSADDLPLYLLRSRPSPPSPQQPIVKKKKAPTMPMSKVQQMMRERDPTYMTETNILTIVEYSFVCPFKCRHNHLICYYCGENFSDPLLLRDHTQSSHHPKKFKVTEHKNMIKLDLTRIDCRLCPIKINSLEEFKRHITMEHNKKYYFDYKDSVLPFKLTKEELKCALCDIVFPYFHALNKHMNEHFSNYVCETCGLGFVDKGRFVMHQQRHEEGDFPCETCGKIFKAQYNRDLHIDRVHKKRGRVYCPKCDVKLMSYPQKLKHLVEVHGEQPLQFPCNMCDKVCETRRTLTIHRRKDHLKDYRYECQCCGQKFFTRFALNNHMPTHTGERNFKCKVCDKCYPRLKTLKDHMRIHSNDRRYRCHVCAQAFVQNCSLKGHLKTQHPDYG